jgi:20S proteasome alpha/beta subunit
MTLAAAFRGSKGGILLCADREWNDAGISKKEINKLFEISKLPDCDFFIAGSGPDAPIFRAYSDIRESLFKAAHRGADILDEYRDIFESTLYTVHQKFARLLKQWPMSFLVVAVPRALDKPPILYRTEGPALIPEPFYFAVGSGRPIADYLAGRLYEFGELDKKELVTVAAFILREAADSCPGVGMGANMVWIRDGDKFTHFIPPKAVKLIQEGIPKMRDAVNSYWLQHAKIPDGLGL